MSCYSGPETINDGLILSLDASNIKSYSGTGTTMTDISGKANSVTGTISTTSAAPGTVIDYNTSGIITCTFPAIDKTAFTLTYTGRGTGLPSSDYREIFSFYDTNTIRYYVIDNRTAATPYILHYVKDFSLSSFSTFNVTTNAEYLEYTWNQFVLVVDGLKFSSYKNGVLLGTNIVTQSLTNYTNVNKLVLNGAGSNSFQIYSVQLHNKVLSASEISQNFNATRFKYGR